MKTTKTMTTKPLPRSEPRDGNTTGNHPPLPQSHAVPRHCLRPTAVLALALSTGLWTVPLLHPPTALAAAPVTLTLKGQYDTSGSARGVAVAGNHAYVADWDAGLQVIDVSNPANPVRVGGVDTAGRAVGVALAGNHAYVADLDADLQVIDVSNPANPVRVGSYPTSEFDSAVAVAGNLIYVAGGADGLLIFEQSRPLWLEVSGLNPFTISLSGEPGTEVRLQHSSNLRDWEDWQSATLSDAPLEFPDPDATGATARFYRAVKQ